MVWARSHDVSATRITVFRVSCFIDKEATGCQEAIKFNTFPTSQVVVYLGKLGLSL